MIFRRQTQTFYQLHQSVAIFYWLNFALLAVELPNQWTDWEAITRPLWPVRWGAGIPPLILALLSLAGAFLGALWWKRVTGRGLALLSVGTVAALESSLGKINHHYHAWLWIAFLLLFLPPLPALRRSTRQKFLDTAYCCGALLVGFYFLTAFWKLGAALHQFGRGEPSLFSPGYMASHTAFHLLTEGRDTLLGSWGIQHTALMDWLGRLHVGLLLVSPLTLKFRSWLRPLAFYLVAFHVANALVLDIWYIRQSLLCWLWLPVWSTVRVKCPRLVPREVVVG